MSLGFASPYKMTYDGYSNWMVGTEKGNSEPMFKYGINGYVGIEYKMPDAPITFGTDFRPGYGLLAVSHYSDGDLSESVQYHYFDWHLSHTYQHFFYILYDTVKTVLTTFASNRFFHHCEVEI